ncbi:hypothetical protein SDC9_92894 [bioreactor metagenome]|uniref:1-deoxy-D-xylulose-5-phosphate synthase n=1 Tax=bioreactor metagenome TaxID=1076179 RepID=A0A644ZZW3_9ZZZZ
MRTEIRYIELKSGYSDNGPAWIGKVAFSNSGRTLFFMDKGFQKKPGYPGGYFDVETGETYWITGVKKRGTNRHWAGGGMIQLDRTLVDDYLKHTGQTQIDRNLIQLVDIPENYPFERIHKKMNATVGSKNIDCL